MNYLGADDGEAHATAAAALSWGASDLVASSRLDEAGALVDELRRLCRKSTEEAIKGLFCLALIDLASHLAKVTRQGEARVLIEEALKLG